MTGNCFKVIKKTTVSLNKICTILGVQISSAMGKGVSVAPFARRDNPNNVVGNPNWQLMPHP